MFRHRRRRHADEGAELDRRTRGDLAESTSDYSFPADTGDDGLGRAGWGDAAVVDASAGPTGGPFDSTKSPHDEFIRVDLGSLRVPVLPGVNIHPQVEDNHVSAIVLVHDGSALQVIPFAAPLDDGAWGDIRHDLRVKMETENYSPRDCEGEFDVELLANLPSQNGRQLVRFLGIDGPRWFIRAMFTGAAASDPAAGVTLIKVLRNTVVVRGNEPRPVRDPLPMNLPDQASASAKNPVEQPRARVAEHSGARGRRRAVEPLPSREQAPAQSPYLAGTTYRERFGPVADETIEIRGLPFADDDELALTHR
ncbi:MAG: DUF3710 domain-containing protein [Mycobacteriales bacterium]